MLFSALSHRLRAAHSVSLPPFQVNSFVSPRSSQIWGKNILLSLHFLQSPPKRLPGRQIHEPPHCQRPLQNGQSWPQSVDAPLQTCPSIHTCNLALLTAQGRSAAAAADVGMKLTKKTTPSSSFLPPSLLAPVSPCPKHAWKCYVSHLYSSARSAWLKARNSSENKLIIFYRLLSSSLLPTSFYFWIKENIGCLRFTR